MFLGLSEHTLDDKGRLVLPRKHRDPLRSGCVVSKHFDGSLGVWPSQAFDMFIEQTRDLPSTRGDVRSFVRTLHATAESQEPDKQGRINIPEVLRRYAGLESTVVVTGADTHLELWSPEKWAAVEAEDDDRLRTMDVDLRATGRPS